MLQGQSVRLTCLRLGSGMRLPLNVWIFDFLAVARYRKSHGVSNLGALGLAVLVGAHSQRRIFPECSQNGGHITFRWTRALE